MLIRKGDRGDEVKKVQAALGLTADGIFGSGTEEAVKEFQTKHGLSADGIVGPNTLDMMLEEPEVVDIDLSKLEGPDKALRAVFGKYFKTDELATEYARQPEKIANRVYASRMSNGDEESGDGWKYRGRGYIQLTGKHNYSLFNESVDDDVVESPELVKEKYPLLSAAWFWSSNGLNRLADGGSTDEVVTKVTKRVNGGTIGLEDRIKHFHEYYELLK